MIRKTSITKKQIGLIVVIVCIIAFVEAIVIEHREQELCAILASIAVSGVSWAITDNVFVRNPALHSPLLYYVTIVILVALGFLTYAILTSFPPMSPWGVKLTLSILASISIILPCLFLARLMKVNTVPWKKIDDRSSIDLESN